MYSSLSVKLIKEEYRYGMSLGTYDSISVIHTEFWSKKTCKGGVWDNPS